MIHVKLSKHYGMLQGMKPSQSPQAIIREINDYFNTDITVKRKKSDVTSNTLKQVMMKILSENYDLKDEVIASLLGCGRVNVLQMRERFNTRMPFDVMSRTLYTLVVNIIVNKNSENNLYIS